MKIKTCCILNIAPIYRIPIFNLMGKELPCDFFVGDKVGSPIKKMDYAKLLGFTKELQNKRIYHNFYWQKGAVAAVFKPYKNYILTGEPFCLSSWLILILAKILGKKTYLWSHGWYGNETRSKRILKKIFFNLATKLLLYGDYARELMIKEGFKADKLIPIYNSLDYDSQINFRNKSTQTSIYFEHFGNRNPVLLYVGRIQKIKKLDLLIEVVGILSKEENHACNLVIIGRETDDFELKNLVDKLGLQTSVWFYGESYKEEELAELIYNATLSVTPGNIGLTVMHSMVYGLPVITHNNFAEQGPEFEAIQPGFTGDYFEEDNINDLLRVIKSWLVKTNNQKENVRNDCYKIIDEKYNPHNQIKILKSVLST
ncbi:glycosyltransferase [Arachidicoccus soli]|uniref:Glycosyltransferase n=1 Tax=Arachidicoccus soli TaxID=2341117 RepID=A0A386HQD4_9BACT|nr:glycosyltransferase [Arachidicoccus soli]AYD47983.1 glycosyltransferase [Arachidicoccus soli]